MYHFLSKKGNVDECPTYKFLGILGSPGLKKKLYIQNNEIANLFFPFFFYIRMNTRSMKIIL